VPYQLHCSPPPPLLDDELDELELLDELEELLEEELELLLELDELELLEEELELLLELDELELLEEELELLLELDELELLEEELLDELPPEQVGRTKLPLCVPWNPKLVLWPADKLPFHATLVAVTVLPEVDKLTLQEFVMAGL
jgi:hypothetical protein